MKQTYTFPQSSENGAVRLLQLTDPHLFAEADGQLLGVNTHASFQAVLAEVQAQGSLYDVILATGDLVQDHNPAAYHRFARLVEPLQKPIFWVVGNHDIQPQMGELLSAYPQIQPHKHLLAGDHWQLILLDSHVPNVPGGMLSQVELDFLTDKLRANPNRHSLIVLHHNILPTKSAWLDQHSLSNAAALAEAIRPFEHVKAILHGHIHQEVDSLWQGCRVLATPSTCIQFKPACEQFTLDLVPQGWREITLYPDGRLETTVKRLKSNEFLPNLAAVGY